MMFDNDATLLNKEMGIDEDGDEEGFSGAHGHAKKMKLVSNNRGPLDNMFKPDFAQIKQSTLDKNNPVKEQLKMKAWNSISKWTSTNGIPFNAVRCPSFQEMIYDIGEYGRGMPAPSYHHMRTTLFSNRLRETKEFVASFREHWRLYGCSIMSDFWTDGKGRCLINFLVNCPKGTVFLKSIDASEHIKDANFILQLVNEVIEVVGQENIVQFITDNGSNFKAAGRILEEEHPTIFWTPCAAHCLNLMLQDISEKIPKIKSAVLQGKTIVGYIYNHTRVLSMMRDLTGGKELHKSCVTRFATNFYTLKSIHENRHHLQVLFVSERWSRSDFAKKLDGKKVTSIVAKNEFWDNVLFACKALAPLVDVLRMVDTEQKPNMGYLYEAMDRAKEQIEKNLSPNDRVYAKISEIIDRRWDDQLHHPLHAAAFYLNPTIFYKNKMEIEEGYQYREIKMGLYKAINKLVLDDQEHDQTKLDLRKYFDAAGLLGTPSAVRQIEKLQPCEWWLINGIDVPALRKFAVRVLSLTCSASPCERNWSAFDHLHSKKRNRFLQAKLNDCVFIQYNNKLKRRYEEKVKYNVGDKDDPIFLPEVEENDEWIIPTDETIEEFVREGDDLTWSQVREAMEPTDIGPSTRGQKRHSTYTHLDEDEQINLEDIAVEDDAERGGEDHIGNDDNDVDIDYY